MSGWRVRIEYDADAGPPAPWRPGYALPRRWKATVEAVALPYTVELEFTAGDDGPSCRAVRLEARDGGEISPSKLRFPLGKCIQLAIGAAALREGRGPGGINYSFAGSTPGSHWPGDSSSRVEAFKLARPADVRTKDARLREVAEIYKGAQEQGKPTLAVQDALHCSYSTAARLVGEARRRGFLPPARRHQPEGNQR